MTKRMVALGPEVHLDAGARAALATDLMALGATSVHLNVDDEHVAGAMRFAHDRSYAAVVSVWGQAPTDADLLRVLGDVPRGDGGPGYLAGWEVDERRPIEPPETADGERTEALTNLALLRRPAELTAEEWQHRWQADHTPVAIATQGTFGYVQNRVLRPLDDASSATGIAALVEEFFPLTALTDMHAFYGSDGTDDDLNDRITRLMASCARFGADRDLDLVPTSRYTFGS